MKTYKSGWIGLCTILILAGTAALSSAAVTNTVLVRGSQTQPGFFFNPSNIVIAPGDAITWTNISTTSHDVTHGSRAAGSNTTPYWAQIRFTGLGNRSTVTFSNVGAYPYICYQHVVTLPQPNAANPTQTGLVTVAIQNLPPTVAITSPTNLSRFTAPASFLVTADAADPDLDGSVTNVQFFSGTNLLGADTTAPYSIDLSSLAGGFYPLTARAVDNLGGASTSAVVNVLVNSNRTVEVVGTTFNPKLLSVTVGDTVTFNGLASFHTVTGSGTVEPFCGSSSFPASCAVTFNTVGNFPFHCIPHRTFFMTGSVEVIGPNFRPTGRITAPASGFTVLTGATFTVSAEAGDLFGRVASVRFERPPNVTVGLDTESPYSVTTSIAAPGAYQISARVTDNTALFTLTDPITVNVVTNILSPIQLSSPMAGPGGFQFDYTANPGLSYVIEGAAADGSPVPFVPLATNVASTNIMTFADPSSSSRSNRVYRVRRQP